MTHHDDSHADEFEPIVAQLRAHRPEATELELDAVKRRVRARVARPAGRRARSAEFMKSRLAILSMLVAGMLLSTAGAGLAVEGLSQNDDAALEQYVNNPPSGDVLGEDDTSGGGVAGEDEGGAPAAENDVQPARQVESGAGTGELPFTGFLAIP